jgi:hypothetical protein
VSSIFVHCTLRAATRTDDWAWAMHVYGVSEPLRYGLIVVGAAAYLWTIRLVAARMISFAHPKARAKRIVLIGWVIAGLTAAAAVLVTSAALLGPGVAIAF